MVPRQRGGQPVGQPTELGVDGLALAREAAAGPRLALAQVAVDTNRQSSGAIPPSTGSTPWTSRSSNTTSRLNSGATRSYKPSPATGRSVAAVPQ
ncbi:hypothetical protein ABT084_11295 [Streptomyces sp. NPDC002138]|uniref:hypothetical protein n=1 Tax=Streptomyces sp. NPDC002138 TaxID=3154410 RepID=UPI00332BA976